MMAGNAKGTGPYHIQSEINMIPLIDVALVLLIIFMVISPMLVESQLKVNLPKVTSAAQAEETALKIEIDSNGRISFQGKLTLRNKLKKAMKKELPEGHQSSLFIQADKNVAFGDVVFVMDVAKQLQVRKLGVAVVPEFGQ